MAANLVGLIDWGGTREKDGHRDYFLRWLVRTDFSDDGPPAVFNCPGLPAIGSVLSGDSWAFCHPDWRVSTVLQREPNFHWVVDTPFSTKPLKRCQDTQIENPLDEPPRISGNFVKYVKEIHKDRLSVPLKTPSHEALKGPVTEFDDDRPTVSIELTSLTLPLGTIAPLFNTVNDSTLWGLGARKIKLATGSWKRLLYGTCSYYFIINYEFEINYNTFDRDVPAFGYKCLKGWMPGSRFSPLAPLDTDPDTMTFNHLNPKNYEQYKDINGENTGCFMDEYGRPVEDESDIHDIHIEHYNESNFLVLGIPTSFT